MDTFVTLNEIFYHGDWEKYCELTGREYTTDAPTGGDELVALSPTLARQIGINK